MRKYVVERWEREAEQSVLCEERWMKTQGWWGTTSCEVVALATTWGHGDISAHAAMEGHVWVCGPAAAGFCVDVCGPCYHQRPCRCPCSGLMPGAILMLEGSTELVSSLNSCELGERPALALPWSLWECWPLGHKSRWASLTLCWLRYCRDQGTALPGHHSRAAPGSQDIRNLAQMVSSQERWSYPLSGQNRRTVPGWYGYRRAGRLSNSATTQAHIQFFELAIFTPSMNSWYPWRDQCCKIKVTGSPWHRTTDYARWVPVRIQYW